MEDEIYSNNKKSMFLEHDMIDGFKYFIVSHSSHPCAYVEIPKGHKLFGMDCDDIHEKYEIWVHGGLTYSEDHLSKLKNKWFIGWDYAHYGDYTYFPRDFLETDEHEYSLNEIRNDVINVIKQIVNLSNNEKENEAKI